jgi:hypothetical protein
MAHTHYLGYGLHRQAVFVGRPDSFVSFLAELVGNLLHLSLMLGVFLGKGRKTGFGLRCLAFWTSDTEDRPGYSC